MGKLGFLQKTKYFVKTTSVLLPQKLTGPQQNYEAGKQKEKEKM
jgi:hypothetical protein